MKLFFTATQESKIADKTVDVSSWKSDLNTEITASKTVTSLLNELRNRVAIDDTKYTVSDEAVLSDGKATKKTDKVESLDLRAISYKFTVTKK